jgi:hypothetical protein
MVWFLLLPILLKSSPWLLQKYVLFIRIEFRADIANNAAPFTIDNGHYPPITMFCRTAGLDL